MKKFVNILGCLILLASGFWAGWLTIRNWRLSDLALLIEHPVQILVVILLGILGLLLTRYGGEN